jgi:hypothetical protein
MLPPVGLSFQNGSVSECTCELGEDWSALLDLRGSRLLAIALLHPGGLTGICVQVNFSNKSQQDYSCGKWMASRHCGSSGCFPTCIDKGWV